VHEPDVGWRAELGSDGERAGCWLLFGGKDSMRCIINTIGVVHGELSIMVGEIRTQPCTAKAVDLTSGERKCAYYMSTSSRA
jgi:hypothetical protein